jgi:4-hydroxymandelate oxidase
MNSPIVRATNRRRFLQYLAGSPMFASHALSAYGAEAPSKLPDPMIWAPAGGEPIKNPKDAINVFDFEPVARNNVPPAISAIWRPASTTRSRCAPTARGS